MHTYNFNQHGLCKVKYCHLNLIQVFEDVKIIEKKPPQEVSRSLPISKLLPKSSRIQMNERSLSWQSHGQHLQDHLEGQLLKNSLQLDNCDIELVVWIEVRDCEILIPRIKKL